jgi:hypothetical protein
MSQYLGTQQYALAAETGKHDFALHSSLLIELKAGCSKLETKKQRYGSPCFNLQL